PRASGGAVAFQSTEITSSSKPCFPDDGSSSVTSNPDPGAVCRKTGLLTRSPAAANSARVTCRGPAVVPRGGGMFKVSTRVSNSCTCVLQNPSLPQLRAKMAHSLPLTPSFVSTARAYPGSTSPLPQRSHSPPTTPPTPTPARPPPPTPPP